MSDKVAKVQMTPQSLDIHTERQWLLRFQRPGKVRLARSSSTQQCTDCYLRPADFFRWQVMTEGRQKIICLQSPRDRRKLLRETL